jgi:hypothetical protein
MVALGGLSVSAAACLESVWRQTPGWLSWRTLAILFSILLVVWLTVMLYGCFIWNLTMPFYRPLGIAMSILVVVASLLGWSALSTRNARRAIATVALMAIGLKLVHWCYYVPEWNYRNGQGPWGRAIGQWIPRKWPVYTFHDWPTDLAFAIERPVRQMRSPRFLNYLPGGESRFVLLLNSEFDNWPEHAPPISLVTRFQDPWGSERILARTAGLLPIPGQSAAKGLAPEP